MYKNTTNNPIEQHKKIIFFGRTRFWQEDHGGLQGTALEI
jgi:hypothetical protein